MSTSVMSAAVAAVKTMRELLASLPKELQKGNHLAEPWVAFVEGFAKPQVPPSSPPAAKQEESAESVKPADQTPPADLHKAKRPAAKTKQPEVIGTPKLAIPESYDAVRAMKGPGLDMLANQLGIDISKAKTFAAGCSMVWKHIQASKKPSTPSVPTKGTVLVADGKGGSRTATVEERLAGLPVEVLWAAVEAMTARKAS